MPLRVSWFERRTRGRPQSASPSFAGFYAHHAPAVLRYFSRHTRDVHRAFDLTAETFVGSRRSSLAAPHRTPSKCAQHSTSKGTVSGFQSPRRLKSQHRERFVAAYRVPSLAGPPTCSSYCCRRASPHVVHFLRRSRGRQLSTVNHFVITNFLWTVTQSNCLTLRHRVEVGAGFTEEGIGNRRGVRLPAVEVPE